MNIYKIKRDDYDVGYDEAAGFIITARDTDQARQLAVANAGDEAGVVWLDSDLEVERIGTNADDVAKVELRDFRNG